MGETIISGQLLHNIKGAVTEESMGRFKNRDEEEHELGKMFPL